MRSPKPDGPLAGHDLSRRSVLLGAAGLTGAVLLGACSTERSGGQVSAGTGGTGGGASPNGKGQPTLVAIFDSSPSFARAGIPQRFAFAVAGPDGAPTKDVPASLDVTISQSGKPIGAPITVERHVDGVPIAYFPLRFTPEQPGTYQAATTINGTATTAAFMVGTAKEATVPQVGEKLLAVDTPTTSDARGVKPICTRKPDACSLHTTSLTEVLTTGQPIAFLVSTPQFCQIGVCGPVLELLLEQHQTRPAMSMVHAEVYKDTSSGNIATAELAPAVEAYHLAYEPSLFVAKADGTIVDRLDNVFDRAELKTALDKAAA